MDTTNTSEKENVELQERGVALIEDSARPAEQILAEQSKEDGRPLLFIP